jgi:REP element-mobilizing transposase RayT
MARALRIEYPGAVYHLTCRGNNKRAIFDNNSDREAFLEILAQSRQIFSVRLMAYVLMENHFHLLVETPLGNLSKFMRRFNITYTGYFNRTHQQVGHVYQGRYQSFLIEKESYLSEVSRYIHLNPVRTKDQEKTEGESRWNRLRCYPWSSLPGYLDPKNKKPFVDCAFVLEEFGGDTPRGRRAYQRRMMEDLSGELATREKVIGQAVLGRDDFIDWVKKTFLWGVQDREVPGLTAMKRYRRADEILEILCRETGSTREELMSKRHPHRAAAMDLLYRAGGLTGVEIGEIFGVDYSTVSQIRKRLSQKMVHDRDGRRTMEGLNRKISI